LSFIGGGSEERTKWRFGHGVIRRTGR
jgi:hypothetical protein